MRSTVQEGWMQTSQPPRSCPPPCLLGGHDTLTHLHSCESPQLRATEGGRAESVSSRSGYAEGPAQPCVHGWGVKRGGNSNTPRESYSKKLAANILSYRDKCPRSPSPSSGLESGLPVQEPQRLPCSCTQHSADFV